MEWGPAIVQLPEMKVQKMVTMCRPSNPCFWTWMLYLGLLNGRAAHAG